MARPYAFTLEEEIRNMKAYEHGFMRGLYLKRLECKGVIGAAVNPYKRKEARDQWQQGFTDSYYGVTHD